MNITFQKADGMYDVESAPELIVKVTAALDPIMVTIPERELGNGMSSFQNYTEYP